MDTTLGFIILYTTIGGLVSLLGGLLLLAKENIAYRLSHYITSFAAGALLGTAFFDLLPEATHEAGEMNLFPWVLVGILGLFFVERIIHWHPHHHAHDHTSQAIETSVVPVLVISDTVHNLIDGMVIGLTFLVDPTLGLVTAVAVAAHEIPQEIGNFGIMLHKGVKRRIILLANLLSAVAAVVGGIFAYIIGERIEALLPILLALAAGFFIYISVADLLPEIHHEENKHMALIQTILLLTGIFIIYVLVTSLGHQ